MDGAFSIIISAISAILYTNYGVFVPLYFSMSFSFVAIVAIHFLWEENKSSDNFEVDHKRSFDQDNNQNQNEDQTNQSLIESDSFLKVKTVEPKPKTFFDIIDSLKESFVEFKKNEVLYLGIVESISNSALGFYLFTWTPILNSLSPNNHVNVGFVFICYVLALIGGSISFEIAIIKLKFHYYTVLFYSLIAQVICFLIVVYTRSFKIALICFSVMQGFNGFFGPLFSIIKSNVVVEKYRSQIMSLFRVPLNIYVCILLLLTYVLSPTKVKNFNLDFIYFSIITISINFLRLQINKIRRE